MHSLLSPLVNRCYSFPERIVPSSRDPRRAMELEYDAVFPWADSSIAMWCDTDGSVVANPITFGAVGGTDWNMAAPDVLQYTAAGSAALSKQVGPEVGQQALRCTSGGGASFCYHVGALFTVGNTYRLRCRKRGDGASPWQIRNWSGALLQNCSASNAWDDADITWIPDGASGIYFDNGAGPAGAYFELGPITIDCLNVAQANDLSGKGNHPVQATVANQPLSVASGTGGILRFSGDWLRKVFAFVAPHTTILCAKLATPAATKYALDGGSVNKNVFIVNNAPGVNYSRDAGIAKQLVYGNRVGAWHLFSARAIDAVTTTIQCDNETSITGDAGADSPGGVTIGAAGDPGSVPADMDCVIVIACKRPLDDSDMAKVYRYWTRKRIMLGL